MNGEKELASPRNEKKVWAKVEGHGVAWGMWKCVTGSELLELRDRRSGGEAGGVCRAQRPLLERGPIQDHMAMNPQS